MSNISFFITGQRDQQMVAIVQRGETMLVGTYSILPDAISIR